MNTRQQEKYVLVEYMKRFKQDNLIVKSSNGEAKLDHFVETNIIFLRKLMKWIVEREELI